MNQTETMYKGPSNTKLHPRPVKNNLLRTVSRPDWILYTVPAFAFLIGIVLFVFICKTKRHGRKYIKHTSYKNERLDNYNSFRHSTDDVLIINTKKKDDAQSYENVEAAIYTNQEKITFYVPANPDYITPDEVNEQDLMEPTAYQDNLSLPHNLTDTDGESYENMANLYAHPRKCSQQHKPMTAREEDYITPDEVNEQDLMEPTAYQDNLSMPHNLTDTDGESYENMANLYAHPRKCSQQHKPMTAREEDYIHPDQDGLQDATNTDTESYEMMADSHCSYKDFTQDDYINPDDDGHKELTFEHTDTDSYEQMNEIP